MLRNFLEAKPLYYTEIDYTRMPRAYESIKDKLQLPKIIHIIGTNGKGTTGRFLATALHNQNYKVLHYTSPHILEFNERIWINGKNISDEQLESLHQELLTLLNQEFIESLSYFEYTTFLAVLAAHECDYLILEAGLGGEHDATSVFENVLTLVTPIDKDHEAFLGKTIKSIATTKLNAVQHKAILAKQKHQDIYSVAKKIALQKSVSITTVENYITKEDDEKISQITQQNTLPTYLIENLRLSISALKELGIEYTSNDFLNSKLFGRLTQLNQNVLIDVGHNALAAEAIYEVLKGSKYTLVYNSYKDKDYKQILKILKPIIKELLVIKVVDSRIEKRENLESALIELNISFKQFEKVDDNESYLVFGSFSVVEEFLKVYRG
ncbi:bifunctional folylpolyglutamate synthase/dihydrofolate synthase [Sulfurimonas sp.]|uniref:bifunctional folylpolyglutamate synthase/dihydrofolate synthase n=1 Tax=Sulfurimonas sp. TaxID=2022749 RepID=UPI003D10E4B8